MCKYDYMHVDMSHPCDIIKTANSSWWVVTIAMDDMFK